MNLITCSMKQSKKMIIMLSLIMSPSFAAVISITPSTTEVMIGNQFCADILVTDPGVNAIPGAFDLNIQYDPSILQFQEYSLIGGISDNAVLDLSVGLTNPGEVNICGLSLLDNYDNTLNTFKLASVVFKAIGEGTSILGLSNVTLANYFGEAINTVVQNSSVQAVPESSSTVLMSLGIFCFVVVLRTGIYRGSRKPV